MLLSSLVNRFLDKTEARGIFVFTQNYTRQHKTLEMVFNALLLRIDWYKWAFLLFL